MLGLSHNRVNSLRLCFENKLSHFFLPPTVNKWIQKRIQNSKRAGPLKGNGWLFLSPYLWEEHWNWSWNNQGRETKTTYTVVFSALLYLRNLSASPCGICWVFIIFRWRRVSRYKTRNAKATKAMQELRTTVMEINEIISVCSKHLKNLRSETDSGAPNEDIVQNHLT